MIDEFEVGCGSFYFSLVFTPPPLDRERAHSALCSVLCESELCISQCHFMSLKVSLHAPGSLLRNGRIIREDLKSKAAFLKIV